MLEAVKPVSYHVLVEFKIEFAVFNLTQVPIAQLFKNKTFLGSYQHDKWTDHTRGS